MPARSLQADPGVYPLNIFGLTISGTITVTRTHCVQASLSAPDGDEFACRALEEATLTLKGGELILDTPTDIPDRARSHGLTAVIHVPHRIVSLLIDTTSGDWDIHGGGITKVDFASTAGRLNLAAPCSNVRYRSVYGSLTTDSGNVVNAKTTSGHLTIGASQDVHAETGSGNITLTRLFGNANLNSLGGDISVTACEPGQINAGTVSGNIAIVDAANLGNRLSIRAQSMSGTVTIN